MPNGPELQILAGLSKLSLAFKLETLARAGHSSISSTQTQILDLLAKNPEQTWILSEITHQLGVTKATLSDSINNLVMKNLIKKESCPHDQRKAYLKLTARGQKIARTSEDKSVGFLADSLDLLTETEKGILIKSLIILLNSFQENGKLAALPMCVSCQHFIGNDHPEQKRPHYCRLLKSYISNADLRLECPEQRPAATADISKNWNDFIRCSAPAKPKSRKRSQ